MQSDRVCTGILWGVLSLCPVGTIGLASEKSSQAQQQIVVNQVLDCVLRIGSKDQLEPFLHPSRTHRELAMRLRDAGSGTLVEEPYHTLHFELVPERTGPMWVEISSMGHRVPDVFVLDPDADWLDYPPGWRLPDSVWIDLSTAQKGKPIRILVAFSGELAEALELGIGFSFPFQLVAREGRRPERPVEETPAVEAHSLDRIIDTERSREPQRPLYLAFELEKRARARRQFDLEGARADYEEHLELTKDSRAHRLLGSRAWILAQLGEVRALQEDSEAALAAFDQALDEARRAAGPFTYIMFEKGLLLEELGDIERAAKCLKKAVDNAVVEEEWWVNSGILARCGLFFARNGDEAEAAEIAQHTQEALLQCARELNWFTRNGELDGELYNPQCNSALNAVGDYCALLIALGKERDLADALDLGAHFAPYAAWGLGAALAQSLEGKAPVRHQLAFAMEVDRLWNAGSRWASDEWRQHFTLATGKTLLDVGALRAAKRFLLEAVESRPEAHLFLAQAEFGLGNWPSAKRHALAALDGPSAALAEVLIAAVDYLEDADSELLSDLRAKVQAVVKEVPQASRLLFDLGRWAQQAGQSELALEYMALMGESQAAEERLLRAAALASLGRTDEAVSHLDEVLSAPTSTTWVRAHALFDLGSIAARQSKWSVAIDRYREALDELLKEPIHDSFWSGEGRLRKSIAEIRRFASGLASAILESDQASISSSDHARLAVAKDAEGWLSCLSRDVLFEHSTGEERELLSELRALQAQAPGGDSDVERKRLEAQLAAAVSGKMPWLTRADVQRSLASGTVLLDFHEYTPRPWGMRSETHANSERRFLAAVVPAQQGTIHLIDLGSVAEIERAVVTYLSSKLALDLTLRGVSGVEEANAPTTAGLTELIWDPLAKYCRTRKRIVVSPHGTLAGVPFGVLRTRKGRYLLEERSFVYVDGAWMLGRKAERVAPSNYEALLVGGVDFTGHEANDYSVRSKLSYRANGGAYLDLPGSREEVSSVRQLHSDSFRRAKRYVLTENSATEGAVKEHLNRAAIIHFATHGFFVDSALESATPTEADSADRLQLLDYPAKLSGLVLATGDEEDGLLSADEILWLDGRSWDLIVLSACRTAVGRQVPGEGFASLRRSFHIAGAPRVISSCWSIPDEETGILMKRFYANLWKRRLSAENALRDAQLSLLRDKRKQGHEDGDPASWGSLILSGVLSGR